VINAQYLNDISLQSIADNEGGFGNHQFARARHSTGAPHLRILREQLFDVVDDVEHDLSCHGRVIFRDMVAKRSQVID
jgi:hypothetical protein